MDPIRLITPAKFKHHSIAGYGSVQVKKSLATPAKSIGRTNIVLGKQGLPGVGADPTYIQATEDRINALESVLNNLATYNFQLAVDLNDDLEDTFSVAVAGVEATQDYQLAFNSGVPGLTASLIGWSNNEIKITVINNTGSRFNETLDLNINQILKPLNN